MLALSFLGPVQAEAEGRSLLPLRTNKGSLLWQCGHWFMYLLYHAFSFGHSPCARTPADRCYNDMTREIQ